MSLQRIIRNRRLSPEEVAEYGEIREQIAEELPELVARHDERLIALGQVRRSSSRGSTPQGSPPRV